MKLYHISLDISRNGQTKVFLPRIPKHRVEYEDNITPRICFSRSIKGALNSFPYKDKLANKEFLRKGETYISVFELEANSVSFRSPTEISRFVPDAELNEEHWVTEPVELQQVVYRVDFLELAMSIDGEQCGRVVECDIRKPILSESEHYEITVFSRSQLNKLRKISNRLGLDMKILSSTRKNLRYSRSLNVGQDYTRKTYDLKKILLTTKVKKDITQLYLFKRDLNNLIFRKNLSVFNFQENLFNNI